MTAPKPPLKAHLINSFAHSRGPVNRLRARRYGLDVITGTPPAVEFYYEPGDPHSHLAAQLLPALEEALSVPLRIFIVLQEESGIYPEIERQQWFALLDAQRIAPAMGLTMPTAAAPVSVSERLSACRLLLPHTGDIKTFLRAEREIASRLFAGEPLTLDGAQPEAETAEQLVANAARRMRLGHYLPAMWQFNGEWFWAIDRFPLLLERLKERSLLRGNVPTLTWQTDRAELGASPDPQQPLEFFYSFRSPYSYLAAVQLQRLLPRIKRPVAIRPVLPMAMRGFTVPLAKRLYILRDTAREAAQLDIPFGFACDPIGAGAMRCLKTFPLATDTQQQLDFLVSASRAAWSEGIDLASDAGLRLAAERAGLNWHEVEARLNGDDIAYAEQNREALFAAGFWGVPSFRLGEFGTWGRDRLWMIEELLRRSDTLE